MNILSQLEEHANNYDLGAMNILVESLSSVQLEENKQGIIDIYNMVYSSGRYDLDCGKVNDPQDFIFFLLSIIDSVQRFFPKEMYYLERGCCYEDLAYGTTVYEDKLRYIQEAIRIYNSAPQTTNIQMSMVRALIDKMEITKQFTSEVFTELLSFFKLVLNDVAFVKVLIHQCFRIRFLPFGENLYWHQRLLHEFESAMHEQPKKNLLVYLDWAEVYHYILLHNSSEIDPEYKAIMVTQTALLLKPLEGYYTEDAELLYRLGNVFTDTAKRSTDNDLCLEYYKTAVYFFTKHHERQQGIWTFPVYVINTLPSMAQIYHELGAYEKVINTFEYGLELFSQVYKHEEDFTLNQYWGDFLIEYTGLVYDYKSPSINRRAEEKLQLALELVGNYQAHPHFSRPYFSMARLAIKSGNKEKCVSLLLQCKEAIRSKGYIAYDLAEALSDEDFREIWDQLQ